MTEDISPLLFALANLDRLSLLSAIQVQRQRLTALAKVIDASAQECSRHLGRLSDSGLIRKDASGMFETTPLGKAMLRLFPAIQVLASEKDFFASHDLSFLPHGFLERIGDLKDGTFVGHVSSVLDHIKRTLSEAREFVWLISDQPIVTSLSLGTGFASRDMPVRLISEPTLDLTGFANARLVLPEQFSIAILGDVKVAMAINETTAGVCFPGLNGKIDFGAGFTGKDSRFRAWCSDLFDHYWARSRKLLF